MMVQKKEESTQSASGLSKNLLFHDLNMRGYLAQTTDGKGDLARVP